MGDETSTRSGFAYQPALDGLRAIAVAAVVVYHGNLRVGALGQGGFLGVDVFFVLSGYLITSLLVVEYDRVGRIALRAFWQRRARRLLPAVLVTLALVAVFAVFEPAQRAGLRTDAVFTLLYVQNWHVVWSHGATASSPLSHTWSLSVEEQWYLVWPVVLWAALRWTKANLRTCLAVVIGLALASAIWTGVLFSRIDPSRAYFGTDTRAQELLVGAAFALFWVNRPARRAGVRPGFEAAAWCSAALVGYEMLRAHVNDPFLYRGGYLLIAVATGIVITAATRSEGAVRRVLSRKPLVLLGLISYGVYLYHRPLFALMTPSHIGFGGVVLFVVRGAAVVVFATLSYRYLERPIRDGRLEISRPSFAAPAAIVLIASMTYLLAVGDPHLPSATHLSPQTIAYFTQRRLHAPVRNQRVLVVGETHAFILQSHLDNSFNGDGIDGVSFGLFGCGIGSGNMVIAAGELAPARSCGKWPNTFHQIVDAYQPDVVVLMVGDQEIFDRARGDGVLRVGTTDFDAMLDHQLDLARSVLAARGARLIVATNPCPNAAETLPAFRSTERDPRRLAAVNTALRSYAALHHLPVDDLAALLCPNGQPLRERGGKAISTNDTGLTDDGARLVWESIAAAIHAGRP